MTNNKLIIGTAQFGLNYGINNNTGQIGKEDAFSILDYAYNNGVTILDTAQEYGNSQKVIGEYNKVNSNRFKVNTKFKIGHKTIKEQLNSNLTQLNQEYVNVYFYHSFEDLVNYPESADELLKLKNDGKIEKIGVSVYENDEFLQAINFDFIDVIQFPYNLLDNINQRNRPIRKSKQKGKELEVRSVFLQGLFFREIEYLKGNIKALTPYLKRIRNLSLNSNISIKELALLYVLQNDQIDNILLGIDSIYQLRDNLGLVEKKLNDDIINEINKINVEETTLLYPKNWQ